MMSLGFEDRFLTTRSMEEWVCLGTGWMHLVVVVASSKKAMVDTGHFSPSLAQMSLENVTPLLTL